VALGLGRIGLVAAGAAAGGLATVSKLAGDFEAQLNTINTIARQDSAGLGKIGEGIRQTFRDTGQPLSDLTAGYYDLLSAGVKVTDAQKELNLAVKLGIGGLGSTAEAVDLLTTAQNSYGLSSAGVAKAADVFAQAVQDGKVKISEISASFANVAPTAHQFGVSIEEIGAAYGFLTARGVPAAEATTQMNRAILDLVKPAAGAEKVLNALGTTGEELIKKQGLVGALQTMRDEADKLGIPFQNLFGRIEGYKFALQTTGTANKGFNAELERMGKSAGTAEAQFGERQKGLNYQLGRLKALAQDAGITIGSALLPKLVPLLERLNNFISTHQDDIAKFGADLAKGIGEFADSISEADIGNFVNGLKQIAGVGKGVVDLFLKLPSGVQALILGGAAINRLSGGLVGAGVGNLLGGAIKIAFDRGGPGNPMFVTVTNPGLGGPGGATGGGGGFGKALGVAIGAVAVAEISKEIGRSAFFDPTVKPAVTFEQSQFQRLLEAGDPAAQMRGLQAIQHGIDKLNEFGLAGQFLFGDQIDELKRQGVLLSQAIEANKQTAEAAQGSRKTEEGILSEAKASRLAAAHQSAAQLASLHGLEQKLIHDPNFKPHVDSVAQFIRLLRRTSEFGARGVGTDIEQGRKTGRDPLGDAFVALVNRLKPPLLKSNVVQGEISRHIKALEQVQGRLLRDGNIAAARHAQHNIDRLNHLIGEVDKTIPHFRRLEEKAERQRQEAQATKLATERGLAQANRQLGIVANKNFSPSFNASIYTTVNANLSTYSAVQTINRVDTIQYNGKQVPLNM
jgi:TP901 family phage tail tape measure protein